MKKIFLTVVLTGFAAAAVAQTSTSTNATTPTTNTNTATGTTTQDPQQEQQIQPTGTSVYNRDTAGTTDTMTTTTSATTTINQSATQTGTAAGGATRNTAPGTAGTAAGSVNSAGTATTTTGTNSTGTPAAGNFAGGATAALTDNQIAGVLITINDAELEAAKMALRRSKLTEVRDFAKKMSADHKSSLHDTKQMYKSYNKSTARSEVGVNLQTEAKKLSNNLERATRDGFDKTYIDQQVTLHEKALATINESLLPNVTDDTLKTHLERTRTAVTEHLNEARDLQTKIQ